MAERRNTSSTKYNNNVLHPSQQTTGDLAARHASVLLASNPQALEQAYDEWAPLYDEDLATISGLSSNDLGVLSAQILLRHFASSILDGSHQSGVQILDYGCGTGVAGPYLQAQGFLTRQGLDGCDLSRGMLQQASNRRCYRHLFHTQFEGSSEQWRLWGGSSGNDDNDNTVMTTKTTSYYYDYIIANAIFAPGQAPPSTFTEFMRLLKPGGHAIFTIRCEYYDKDKEGMAHQQLLQKMIDQQQWQLVAKTKEEYLPKENVHAYVFVMKKL